MATLGLDHTEEVLAVRDRPPSAEDFRNVIGRFASGVTVITTVEDGQPRGSTASAVTSLSLEPPMVVACLNCSSRTGRAVAATRRFAVNILAEDQVELASIFARSGVADKFAGVGTLTGLSGLPLLADALATLECRVVDAPTGGTHFVFLGEVERAAATDGEPLTYFRGQMGRFSRPTDDAVSAVLRTRVLDREIPLDQPLDCDELAVELAAPRMVVYEALARLVTEGMVARGPRGEFVVRSITIASAEDALRARAAIEIGAAAQCVGSLTTEQLADCRSRLASLTTIATDGSAVDLERWLFAAVAFLEHMVSLTGSRALVDSYRRLSVPTIVISLNNPDLRRVGTPRDADLEFHRLLDAYQAGDLASAIGVAEERLNRLINVSRTAILVTGEERPRG